MALKSSGRTDGRISASISFPAQNSTAALTRKFANSIAQQITFFELKANRMTFLCYNSLKPIAYPFSPMQLRSSLSWIKTFVVSWELHITLSSGVSSTIVLGSLWVSCSHFFPVQRGRSYLKNEFASFKMAFKKTIFWVQFSLKTSYVTTMYICFFYFVLLVLVLVSLLHFTCE